LGSVVHGFAAAFDEQAQKAHVVGFGHPFGEMLAMGLEEFENDEGVDGVILKP